MKKVLMIEHFSTGNMYCINLAEELAEIVNLRVLSANTSEYQGSTYFKNDKILYGYYNGKINSIFKYLISQLKVFLIILFGGYDTIHVQSFRKISFELILYRTLRPFYKNFVYTVHNVVPHEENEKEMKSLYELYSFCDKLILHNQASVDKLLEIFPINKEKLYIIPHGIYRDIESYVDVSTKQQGKIEFLTFGLIRKYKGIQILLEAIKILPDSAKEKCHFTIAGKQDEKLDNTNYRGYIHDNNLEAYVTFIPKRIDTIDLINMYNNCEVCILPYLNIYGSGSMLMAYTFKKPVIASDIPSFEENYKW